MLFDSAPVHRLRVALAATRERGFELLNHMSYSLDLAPSNYFLSGNLKQHLRTMGLDVENVKESAVERYSESNEESSSSNGLKKFKLSHEKCISARGTCILLQQNLLAVDLSEVL